MINMPQLPPEVVAVERLLKEAGGSTGGWDDADHERCVCACEKEKERKREREREKVCVCTHSILAIINTRKHAHAREGAPQSRTAQKKSRKKEKKKVRDTTPNKPGYVI
jgi:hypothetical protein